MSKVNRLNILVPLVCLLFIAPGAIADTPRRSGADQAIRKAQYLLRQLSEQKTKLESENTRQTSEIKDLKAQLDKLKQRLNRSKDNNIKLIARVKGDHEKMRNMLERYHNTVDLLRMEKTNVVYLKNAVIERNSWIEQCKSNNEELYATSMVLVDRFQNKGIWQELSQSEPVTGLGDVKLEVIAEDYRYKLEDLQVAKFKEDSD